MVLAYMTVSSHRLQLLGLLPWSLVLIAASTPASTTVAAGDYAARPPSSSQ